MGRGKGGAAAGVLDRVLREIGKSQKLTLQMLTTAERSATGYRAKVREEIAGLREDVGGLQSDLRSVTETVTEMRPKVMAAEERRLESRGVRRFFAKVGATAHVISVVFGGLILFLTQKFFGK